MRMLSTGSSGTTFRPARGPDSTLSDGRLSAMQRSSRGEAILGVALRGINRRRRGPLRPPPGPAAGPLYWLPGWALRLDPARALKAEILGRVTSAEASDLAAGGVWSLSAGRTADV